MNGLQTTNDPDRTPRRAGGALLAPVLLAILLFPPASSALAQGLPRVVVGTATGEPGDAVRPSARIEVPGAAVGVQFDIVFDSAALEAHEPFLPTLGPEWRLFAGNPMPGVLRVLVYSGNVAPLPADATVDLSFRIASRVPHGNLPLVVENVRFAAFDGSDLPAGPPGGGTIRVGLADQGLVEIDAVGFTAGGLFTIGFQGQPLTPFQVERTIHLEGWDTVHEGVTDASGRGAYLEEDPAPGGLRFFRVRQGDP